MAAQNAAVLAQWLSTLSFHQFSGDHSMTECQKVCFDEELIEEGGFQEVGAGRGDYVYEAHMVGRGKGNWVKVEPKKTYSCSTSCQVFMCLILLGLFVGLLIWLATYLGDDVFKKKLNDDSLKKLNDDSLQDSSGFDCNEDYGEWRSKWNSAKQQHCCATMGRGCDVFACNGSPASWEADQRSACCDKGVKEACTPSPHPFNCAAGVSNWRHGWSFGKKKWCCQKEHVACPEPAQKPVVHPVVVHHVVHHLPPVHHRPVPGAVHVVEELQQPIMYQTHQSAEPFRCYAGVQHWFTLWSTAKKHYCCTKSSVFCGNYAHSGTYGGHMAHFVHGDTYHSHAGYGYYTGGHGASYSYGQSGGYSYGHGHFSHGYGHGHFSSYHGSYTAGIPACGLAVAQQCPADWQNKHIGGFHCLHQLARQTSHQAYVKSGGACRPASQGPFPGNDCQDQCRIGLNVPHVYK